MKKDCWLVAVGAGRWQVPGIQAARQARLNVLALDANINAPGFAYANRSVVVDIRNSSAVLSAIAETKIEPDGAIAFCNEAGMRSTARIREHYNLPCAGINLTTALTNKKIQREIWTKNRNPVPQWAVPQSKSEVPLILKNIKGKVIFKPVDGSGSRGISVIEKNQKWQMAFLKAKKHSLVGKVIIERFINGLEYTVETFTHRTKTYVLAITRKKKVPGTNNTVACELESVPANTKKTKKIKIVVKKALQALGYTNGPAHTEILIDKKENIYLVETAGRGGGFMVADGVVPLTSGFDLAKACALQAVGLKPKIPKNKCKKFAVLRFIPSRKGSIKMIKGFGHFQKSNNLICECLVKKGDRFNKASSDGDRLALLLAVHNKIEIARKLVNIKAKEISFKICN